MRYQRRVYSLPEALHDELVAALHARGALGFEVDETLAVGAVGGTRVRLTAWLTEPPPVGFDAFDLETDGWLTRGVRELERASLDEQDWLAPYRARSRPLALGGGFVVDPRDPEEIDGADDPEAGDPIAAPGRRLAIPAQNAFGTGSHETTRLVVAWLLALGRLEALDVLDVGTGSGILAFVAERLGARSILGVDLDRDSVITARANAHRNRCRPRLAVATLDALRPAPSVDLALVNVLPERILDAYPHLLRLLRPGARIVSSGNLATQRSSLLARFAALGLKAVGEKVDGEWVAWLLESRGETR
ncbi:MAG: 50S ribosomal protein L11 methyltransferase [Acidobacteriota bacterium]